MSYVVWDTKTGVYDGAYEDLETAKDVYEYLSSKEREWVIVQIVHPEKPKLSNLKFYAVF